MTLLQLSRQKSEPTPKSSLQPQVVAAGMLGIVALTGVAVAIGFAAKGQISMIFGQVDAMHQSPPVWWELFTITGQYSFAPTVILLLIVLGVMKLSPRPQNWSRLIVVSVLLGLTINYIVWRSLFTLSFRDTLTTVFSLSVFALEMVMLVSSTIQLFLMLKVKDRKRETDQAAIAVLEGFAPSVDIFIPTYNEAEFILRRTVIGCQALDYANKQIYLLDDTQRPEIQALAEELGCNYRTRPDNLYAKAGNLNHTIAQTSSDLIVVFDADFVPTKDFLTRTVGFFQDPTVALVQTPQSFYNSDPIARNLGLENILTPEEEVFYRQIQPIRDTAGSVICSGTSFVVSREALKVAGGFVTDSLSEDYFTGIRIAAKGYRLIYLDEKLSAGLAAENISAHATQRLRWARGTLQAFFIDSNPLTIPGLNPLQRIAHLEGLLHWFTSISRAGFLLIPLAYSFLGVIPVRANVEELLYFFVPYYVVQLSVFSWLNYRARSALLSDIYSLVLCFPIALTVVQAMLHPFSKGFKVTSKGLISDRFSFNWKLASPLILLFIFTAISLWQNLGICMIKGAWQTTVSSETALQVKGVGLGWIWSGYNLLMLSIALLILLDVPKPDLYDWLDLRRVVQLKLKQADTAAPIAFWGVTTMLSEVGGEVALTQAGFPTLELGETLPVTMEIMEAGLILHGSITRTGYRDEFPTVQVLFEQVNLNQHRSLVEMLFCRPGQWRRRETPGEFKSLLILFQILLKPRVLFDRNPEVSAIAVAKG